MPDTRFTRPNLLTSPSQRPVFFTLKTGEGPGGQYVTAPSELSDIWWATMNRLFQERAKVKVNGMTPGNIKQGYTCVDYTSPGYPDFTDTFQYKVPVSNGPRLELKKRRGDILVNDYDRASVTYRCTSGEDIVTDVKYGSDILIDHVWYFQAAGWENKFANRWFIDGQTFFFFYSLRAQVRLITANFTPPIPITAVSIYNRAISNLESNGSVFTKCLSDANTTTMDILTTMAETPEAVGYFYGLMTQVVELVKGVKRKDFALSTAFKKRSEFLKRKLETDLNRIEEAYQRAIRRANQNGRRVSPERLAAIRAENVRRAGVARDRAKARAQQTFAGAVRESTIELTTAVADVWLQFRYAIMPIVYTVEGFHELTSKKVEYLTSREGIENPLLLEIPGLPQPVEATEIFSVFIKRRLSTDKLIAGIQLDQMSANIAVTAWELTTLSFVVDWFLNVGDYLSAVFSNPSFKEQGCTQSWKINISSAQTINGCNITINGAIYRRRKVIEPSDYACLSWNPTLNVARYLDAAALSWQAVKQALVRASRAYSRKH